MLLLLLLVVTCRTVTADSKAHSRASSRRTTDADGQQAAAPQLQLPQLEIGLSEAELKDLAYLLLACNCSHEGGSVGLFWSTTASSCLPIKEGAAATCGNNKRAHLVKAPLGSRP
jgi:hypothetical protein